MKKWKKGIQMHTCKSESPENAMTKPIEHLKYKSKQMSKQKISLGQTH